MEILTEDQMKEIRKSFSILDENGDGRISSNELLRAARLLGLNPTLQEAEEMVREVDEDKSGYIEFDEYLDVMSQRLGAVTSELTQIREACRVLDVCGEGCVTVGELEQALLMAGQSLQQDDLIAVLRACSRYPGDRVNYEEVLEGLRDLLEKREGSDHMTM